MPTAWMDQGFNDGWVQPSTVTQVGPDAWSVVVTEPLGRPWAGECLTLSEEAWRGRLLRVSVDGTALEHQLADTTLTVVLDSLAPAESRTIHITAIGSAAETVAAGDAGDAAGDGFEQPLTGLRAERDGDTWTVDNGVLALRLPASGGAAEDPSRPLPGPILAVRRTGGPWLGEGLLETALTLRERRTCVVATGPLYTAIRVAYTFTDGSTYTATLTVRPGDEVVEVREASTLALDLWPMPRPYREIGSLADSHWQQPLTTIARPCIRSCPSSNFCLHLRGELVPDRMQTHSTAAWEIDDLPLGVAGQKAYTAMRASYVAIDAGWMAVYRTDDPSATMLGVASIDLAHWQLPDDEIHPVHRTPGTNAEVSLIDDPPHGAHFRFPIENITRRWLLILTERPANSTPEPGRPLRLEQNPAHPCWLPRTRRGDLALDKVRQWVTDWDDSAVEHPRVLCTRSDFATIRDRVAAVPELQALWQETRDLRPADRYILEGTPTTLAEVEAITRAGAIVASILECGFIGPRYAIALCRPLRRYALACDLLWDSFTPAERTDARRVMAISAYLMSDGDWWGYAYRPGGTTYLPNFNVDVFACCGEIAMVLGNHPCTDAWIDYCLDRLERDLELHLREDGGGEENCGSYYMTTWQQLYMPLLFALRHTGARDYSADPRILAGARFMLRIVGPPDARDGWQRQMPPIGHHPHARKAFPVLSQLAAFIADSAPDLAAQLMWMWRECGSPVGNLYDHSGPTANPFTRHYLFHDASIVPQPPPFGSHALPHVGAICRTHGLTRQGSYLFLKAGRVHSHHDDDEGSFHYYGRGIPLAMDGLRLENGAPASEHNVVSFDAVGQPSGHVDVFTSTPHVDYIRATIAPRAFCIDQMYLLDTHRSGFTREFLLVKSALPGGIEYLVVKDTVVGPNPCQWNLDVLSREPQRLGPGHLWFPGHAEFDMGLDLHLLEPLAPTLNVVPGPLAADLQAVAGTATRPAHHVDYPVVEHWIAQAPAGPGTTFLALLYPRPAAEAAPTVTYLEREETLIVEHADGRDLLLLRPNPAVPFCLHDFAFQGRAGAAITRAGTRHLVPLDSEPFAVRRPSGT